ncbi:hypothetical protein BH11BAC2_BH11BAC2_12850 [soil metagenome]
MTENIPDSSEFELLQNYDFFLRKKSLSEKVMLLLGECSIAIQHSLKDFPEVLPAGMIDLTPKISKGENLLAAPWFMLDYPRYFKAEDIFAVRTLCWFGHYFSITLHLSGVFVDRYKDRFATQLDLFKDGDYYICIQENQWDHHFGSENYQSIDAYLQEIEGKQSIPNNKGFLKISKKIAFEQWENLPEISSQTTQLFMKVLNSETP